MILLTLFVQFLTAALGTLAFAILFHAPRKEYLYCSITGAIGWIVYYILVQNQFTVVTASLFATFILTILSRSLSVIRKNPVTVFLIPGIFPLVPGAGIYYTSYYLITNDLKSFSLKGTETFKVAGAIVLGIIFGFAIPQWIFHNLYNAKKRS